jgi:hypothetical protein
MLQPVLCGRHSDDRDSDRGAALRNRLARRREREASPLSRSARAKAARTSGSRIRLEIGKPVTAAETVSFDTGCSVEDIQNGVTIS